jgi:hypothetical protein
VEDPSFQALHTTWTGIITVAGSIVAFFTKRLFDQVDAKADRAEVLELKRDLKEFLDRQNAQHASNTERLDRIIMELGRKDR